MDIIAVGQTKDGFQIKTISVKAMDMKEIAQTCYMELGWFGDNFELFKYNASGKNWLVVARHTGRGWVRISTFVKNWDKYATPAWIKSVKSNSYYGE